ncbi:unnamed protein product, partial [marine sediment metagenome]
NSQIDNFCSYFQRQAPIILGIRSVPEDADKVGPVDYQIRQWGQA